MNFKLKYILLTILGVLLFLSLIYITLLSKKQNINNINKEQNNFKQAYSNNNHVQFENAFNNNDFVNANKIADEFLSKNNKDIRALIMKATILAQQASLEYKEKELGDEARKYALSVLKLDPNNLEALRLIAYTYEIQENYSLAHEYYDKVLKLDSNNFKALAQKGHSYDLQGDLANAKKYYELAYKINPNDEHVLALYYRILMINANDEEAKKIIQKLLNISKNSRVKAEALYSLATMEENNDDYNAKAADLYMQSLQMDPKFALSYVGLARQQFNNGEADKSFNNLKRALELNKNQSAASMQLAIQFMSLGEMQSAKTILLKMPAQIDNDITLNLNSKKIMKEAVSILLKQIK